MAKRRNLKKEKALRNQAYARKFRKRSNSGRFNRGRRYGNNNSNNSDEDSMDNQNSESEGAADKA